METRRGEEPTGRSWSGLEGGEASRPGSLTRDDPLIISLRTVRSRGPTDLFVQGVSSSPGPDRKPIRRLAVPPRQSATGRGPLTPDVRHVQLRTGSGRHPTLTGPSSVPPSSPESRRTTCPPKRTPRGLPRFCSLLVVRPTSWCPDVDTLRFSGDTGPVPPVKVSVLRGLFSESTPRPARPEPETRPRRNDGVGPLVLSTTVIGTGRGKGGEPVAWLLEGST